MDADPPTVSATGTIFEALARSRGSDEQAVTGWRQGQVTRVTLPPGFGQVVPVALRPARELVE